MTVNDIYIVKSKHMPLFKGIMEPGDLTAVIVRAFTDDEVTFSICIEAKPDAGGTAFNFAGSTFTISKSRFFDTFKRAGTSIDRPTARREE